MIRSSPLSHPIRTHAAAVGLLALGAISVLHGGWLALAPGDPAPPIERPTLGGEPFRAAWSESALTVVNFWATYCPPCREEMPALEALFDAHAGEGLSVIGVLFDREASDEQAIGFASELGVSYLLVRGDGKLSRSWGGIGTLPTTFLVNRDGRIVRRYVGATGEQIRSLVRDVEALLAGESLGPMPLPDSPEPGREPETGQDDQSSD